MSAIIRHLGARIDMIRREKNISIEELAEALNITSRNVYTLLKRGDMWLSQLDIISKKLDYNFFEVFQSKPFSNVIDISKHVLDDPTGEKKVHLNFQVAFSADNAQELGLFFAQTHALAEELGLEFM